MLEYAYDENGNFTYIENADSKLHTYKCPECNADLIVKNRVFEDRKKDPHFAHKDAEDCIGGSGESLEHRNTKILVYNLLKNSKQYALTWEITDFPDYIISYDILQDIDEIVMEKQTLGKFIPDISLKSNGKLLRAIEIVYTHEDEPRKTREYSIKRVDVLTVKTDKDIYNQIKNNEKQIEIKIKKRHSGKILLADFKLSKEEIITNIINLKPINFDIILNDSEIYYAFEKHVINLKDFEKYLDIANKSEYVELNLKQYNAIRQININLFYRLKAINWGREALA